MVAPIILTPDIERWRLRNPLCRWLKKQQRWEGRNTPLRRLLDKLGVNRQTWYGWLYGTSAPRPNTWMKLTRHTGVSADAYMRWLARKPRGDQACAEPEMAAES